MRDDLENLEDEIKDDIEEKDIKKNDTSDSFLKIDPIKTLDSSSIKVEIETPKKTIDKQPKDNKEEPKATKDDFQNDKKEKDNSKIIKIGLAVLVAIICLGGGYFAYSKFIANDENENFVNDTITQEVAQENIQEGPVEETKENIVEETNNTIEEPIVETSQETVEEEGQEGGPVNEEDANKENDVQVNDDNYDLVVLETVYDEVINKGNEAYLYNFSKNELAIIRNTLYARKGYKFKKKEYQRYFGEKSWYNPTTSSQNILSRNEERLANIIKRYE